MARIRSIKPEFWTDRKLARCTRDARLLYISMWNLADEWGRLHGDARFVKGHCFPYDDDLSLTAVERLLAELEAAGRVQRYADGDDPFLFLPKLAAHQRLEPHKTPSRLPAPPLTCGSVVSTEDVGKIPERPGQIVVQQVAGGMGQVAGGMGVFPRGSTTNNRVNDALALAERLRLVENQ